MTEHRGTKNPRDWKRIIVVAVSVVLAVLFLCGAVWWTLGICGLAGLAFQDDTKARESLGMTWWEGFLPQFFTLVLPAWGIAAGPVILAILAVVWAIRAKRGGG